MNKRQLLWILVAVQILTTFASVGAAGLFGWTLPPVLAEYSHARFLSSPFSNPVSLLRLLLLLTTTGFAFVSWIGLVFLWRGARRLYVVTWVLCLLYMFASGARVDTSVGATFREMGAVVGGVVLGLIYFSDLARRFERAPAERAVAIEAGLGAHRA